MKEEIIKSLAKTGILRARQKDSEKIRSMLSSAEVNVKVTKTVPLSEDSATLIFREVYESIRQLGDAYWWTVGYEPSNHEVSMDILGELSIKDSVKLNYLGRFKQIRHDANYKGFRVTMSQAREILDFWDSCSKDIIKIILLRI
ncbi:MAG TPA: hypothetical protein VJH97_01645 [Candidatus Nanoarchaeia archaeon]|nr:hypothetical protein [Candidatus Nanoarchaeia archaeon]